MDAMDVTTMNEIVPFINQLIGLVAVDAVYLASPLGYS